MYKQKVWLQGVIVSFTQYQSLYSKMATTICVVGPELQAVEINTYVSGYHAYQEKWNPVIGESAS